MYRADMNYAPGRWADPSKSESSTQLHSRSGSRLTNELVEFPPVSPENLIRLGEDLLHVYPIYREHRNEAWGKEYLSSISTVISRGTRTSPTNLSSEEATALAEAFRKVSLSRHIPSRCLTLLVVRPYLDGLTRVAVRIHGPDS